MISNSLFADRILNQGVKIVRKVKIGDLVVVDGTEYRFGPTSTRFFNQLLEKDDAVTEGAIVTIKRRRDGEPEDIPFSTLKEAWRSNQ